MEMFCQLSADCWNDIKDSFFLESTSVHCLMLHIFRDLVSLHSTLVTYFCLSLFSKE